MVFVLRHVTNGEVLLLGMNETYTLGRSRRNSIHLKDATVSKKHATIKLADGHVDLEAENFANGTWLNKARIQRPQRLQSGDVILFGDQDCKYV
ncbi:hypothetical protein HUJ04_000788 [Dendroctonus ponderosae]|nr:hypothetical protein HUJ04_000788 [Dendroctonus ponderosae]